MRRRNITIAVVVILSVLALATWGGTRLGDAGQDNQIQAQLTAATEELSRLQADYSALAQERALLNTQLATTTASYQELQDLYGALEQENTGLEQELAAAGIQLASVQANVASLQDSNNQLLDQLATTSATLAALEAENDSLKADLASADSRYDTLYQQYLVLEAARQFVIENRIQVTLHTETQANGSIWIRGEVTNISGQTIDRFYLLIAHFATDGTLSPLELQPVSNLGPGQSTVVYVLATTGDTVRITALSDD